MKKPAKKTKTTAKAKTTSKSSLSPGGKAAVSAAHARLMAKVRAHQAALKKSGKVKKTTTTRRTLSLNGRQDNRHVVSWKDKLVKLGRLAPYAEADKPRLVLDDYLGVTAAPAVVDFASEVLTWPMYGNDTIGDCTAATVGHEIQAWTRYTGTEVTVTQDDVIQLYSAVSGYDPSTGANDNGAVIQDVLTYWRKSGVPVAGHKILAFAQLKDLSKIKDALWVFGSVSLGVNVPQSALDQFDAGQPWTVSGDGTIQGGHSVPLQYAGAGTAPYQVVTWAKLQGMDQQFLDTYVEEAWVIITDDWLDKNGHTPAGLDLAQLGADLAAMTGDPNPFPAPVPPTPAPTPVPPAPAPVPAPPAPGPDVKAILEAILAFAEAVVADIEKVL